MFPVIDKRETGICLRRLMDEAVKRGRSICEGKYDRACRSAGCEEEIRSFGKKATVGELGRGAHNEEEKYIIGK